MKFTRIDGVELKTHQPTLLVTEGGKFYLEIYLADDSADRMELSEAEYKRLKVERGDVGP